MIEHVGHLDGPRWLGIGAQRSGTTWFTDLLLQHPEVVLGASCDKETHYLNPSLLRGGRQEDDAAYINLFRGASGCAGEFTPGYLRCLWVPANARRLTYPEVVILVILRDPIDRFVSAMRLYQRFPDFPGPDNFLGLRAWTRRVGAEVQWGGMYATQLAAWAAEFSRDQIVVMQYEQIVKAPQEAVERVWGRLGLASTVPLQGIEERSWTSSLEEHVWEWSAVPGFRKTMWTAYRPEVLRVTAEWDLDRSWWPNFA